MGEGPSSFRKERAKWAILIVRSSRRCATAAIATTVCACRCSIANSTIRITIPAAAVKLSGLKIPAAPANAPILRFLWTAAAISSSAFIATDAAVPPVRLSGIADKTIYMRRTAPCAFAQGAKVLAVGSVVVLLLPAAAAFDGALPLLQESGTGDIIHVGNEFAIRRLQIVQIGVYPDAHGAAG